MALQPWVMIAKDIFPFITMDDSCKEMNFMVFFNEFISINKSSKELAPKMPYSWENALKFIPLQPSVTVARAKKSFAKVTHGCKAKIRHVNGLFLKSGIYQCIWQ